MAPEFMPFLVFTALSFFALAVAAAAVFPNLLRPFLEAAFRLVLKHLHAVLLVALVPLLAILLLLGRAIHQQFFLNEPLASAALGGDLQQVQRLLERGASPNAYGVDFVSPSLVYAAGAGHREIVELLLPRGADPNLRDSQGKTALARALENNHGEIANMLQRAGAKP